MKRGELGYEAGVEKYVAARDPAIQEVYRIVKQLLLSDPDTLEDDFQIAAGLQRVFEEHAERTAADA